MDVTTSISAMKHAHRHASALTTAEKNAVLHTLASLIRQHIALLIQENHKDLALIEPSHPLYDRLLLNEPRLLSMAKEIEILTTLPDPIGRCLSNQLMDNGLHIQKITVPLGVVAVIYESRPNVTIDIFSLCFKSGNACLLKGGTEAYHSNTALVAIIKQALARHHLKPEQYVSLLTLDRAQTKILLTAHGIIDVCIPRGSQSLIDFVRQTATIPVIETGAGVVHVYVDASADINKARDIIHNAKTRRVSVCNALDCVLLHQHRLAELCAMITPLQQHHVELFADQETYHVLKNNYPRTLLHLDTAGEHYGTEFLAHKMAIKTVTCIDEAIQHIAMYGSQHSEAIVTEDQAMAHLFTQRVDAAVVYVNASTAFTDGGEFGLGAEIGISTQKLHARGPMGLEALTSYQWIVQGNGHTR